jgi:hypothetical protein
LEGYDRRKANDFGTNGPKVSTTTAVSVGGEKAVGAVLKDVIGDDEIAADHTVEGVCSVQRQETACTEESIVVDRDILRHVNAANELEAPARTIAPGIDAFEQVVSEGEVAPVGVVVAATDDVPGQLDALAGAPDDVVGHRDIFDRGPWIAAALVLGREEDGRGGLVAADPAVVKEVAVDSDVLGVLEFKEILDVPFDPEACRVERGIVWVPGRPPGADRRGRGAGLGTSLNSNQD